MCPVTLTERQMAFGGFEKDRKTLKYICPVQAYGISCAGYVKCPLKKPCVLEPFTLFTITGVIGQPKLLKLKYNSSMSVQKLDLFFYNEMIVSTCFKS